MKKKILLITIMLIALSCLLAISASAANFTYEGVNYSTATDEATGETVAKLAGNTSITTENVEIPSYVKDANGTEYKVVAFSGENFKKNANIKSLVISSQFITSIPAWCFQNIGATTITISSPIETFGTGCFNGLANLTEFKVNLSSTTMVQQKAFSFGQNNVVWMDSDGNPTINLYNLKTIDNYGFVNSSLGSVKIIWPKKLDSLGGWAFENANYSGDVYLNTEKIGSNPFQGTHDIKKLIFGPDVTEISGFATYNNATPNIKTVVFLSDSVNISAKTLFERWHTNFDFYYNSFTLTYNDAGACLPWTTHNMYVITEQSFSYDNDCELSIVLSATSTQKNASGTLKNQDAPLVATNVSLGNEYHLYKSQGVDSEYCPLGSVEGFECSKCHDSIVKIAEGVTPVKGHNHITIQEITYENGYAKDGIKIYACANEGCSSTVSEVAKALIEYLGYSIKNNGSALCVGYTVDRNAISELEAKYTDIEIKLGAVATIPTAGQGSGSPLKTDLTANTDEYEKVLCADLTDGDFYSLDFRIVGNFVELGVCDVEILMSAYISDGESLYYIQNADKANTIYAITYNQILAKQ